MSPTYPGGRFPRGSALRSRRTLLAALFCCCVLAGPAAAATLDLTTLGSEGSIGSGFFTTTLTRATGTGGNDTFVQHDPTGQATTSLAYNTTQNNILDNKAADNFNRSILLSDVPVQNVAGMPHLKFTLDINESNAANETGGEFISLDEVQVFVGGAANAGFTTFTSGVLDHDGALVYRLDAGGDNWLALNADLNSGSGSGDVDFFLPLSMFAAYGPSDVVTLYSEFGQQGLNPAGFMGNFAISGGFEEWGLTAAVTPEPASVLLLAASLLVQLGRRRAR